MTGFDENNLASKWQGWLSAPSSGQLPIPLPFATPNLGFSFAVGVVWSDDHFHPKNGGVAGEFKGAFHTIGGGSNYGLNAYISPDPMTGAPGLMTTGNVGGVQLVGSVGLPVEGHAYVTDSKVAELGRQPLRIPPYELSRMRDELFRALGVK